MIENLPELPQNGQNLLITGKIGTQHFSSLTGKKQTSTHIFAKQIYFCDESYGRYHVKNANRVELQAHICFDITNEETHSVFVLALHFQSKYVHTNYLNFKLLIAHILFNFQRSRWNRC